MACRPQAPPFLPLLPEPLGSYVPFDPRRFAIAASACRNCPGSTCAQNSNQHLGGFGCFLREMEQVLPARGAVKAKTTFTHIVK